jgi:hypothetical protein
MSDSNNLQPEPQGLTLPDAAFPIAYHAHTGTDSPQVDYNDLLNKPAATPTYTHARMYANATVFNINGGAQKIPFDASDYDTLTELDVITNNRWTAKAAGYYFILGEYQAVSGADVISAQIYKNGVGKQYNTNVGATTVSVSDVMPIAIGDYIELYGYDKSGNVRALTNGKYSSFLTIHRLV